jgi:hypothetical protein
MARGLDPNWAFGRSQVEYPFPAITCMKHESKKFNDHLKHVDASVPAWFRWQIEQSATFWVSVFAGKTCDGHPCLVHADAGGRSASSTSIQMSRHLPKPKWIVPYQCFRSGNYCGGNQSCETKTRRYGTGSFCFVARSPHPAVALLLRSLNDQHNRISQ